MVIRRAKRRDVEELLDIYNYEVENGTATFDLRRRTMEERLEWFRAHNAGNHPLLVAEEDGAVAGYASLSSYRDKEAYAETVELSLYVAPDRRGRGVARALMGEILEEARRRGDIHSVVSVITGGNAASFALHREFGFTHCGTMREVGRKFGRLLDTESFQLIVGDGETIPGGRKEEPKSDPPA